MSPQTIPSCFSAARLANEIDPGGKDAMYDFQLLAWWMRAHRARFSEEFSITEGLSIVHEASGAQVGVYRREGHSRESAELRCASLSLRDWSLARQTIADPQTGARWEVPLGTPLEACAPSAPRPARQHRWAGTSASPGTDPVRDAFAGTAMTQGWRFAERWPVVPGADAASETCVACAGVALTPKGIVVLIEPNRYASVEGVREHEARAQARLRECLAPENDSHDTLRALPVRTLSTGPWTETHIEARHARLKRIDEATIAGTVATWDDAAPIPDTTLQHAWDLLLPLEGAGAQAAHREDVLGEALAPGAPGSDAVRGRGLGLRAVIANAHDDFAELQAIARAAPPSPATYAWAHTTARREGDRRMGYTDVELPRSAQALVSPGFGHAPAVRY